MAVRKKIPVKDLSESNYEKIKEEVILLLTGQHIQSGAKFNYMTLLRRVTIILIAVYGIGKVQILRQLAFSIATTLVTGWLAQKTMDKPDSVVILKAR